jgi:hypothetical protein
LSQQSCHCSPAKQARLYIAPPGFIAPDVWLPDHMGIIRMGIIRMQGHTGIILTRILITADIID